VSEAFEVRTGLTQGPGDSPSPTQFNIALEKSIMKMQIETTGVPISQQHI